MTRYAEDFEEGECCPMAVEGTDNVACPGKLEFKLPEDCSCHIAQPCGGCVEADLWCPVCGWECEDVDYAP